MMLETERDMSPTEASGNRVARLDPWIRGSRLLSPECKLVLLALMDLDAVASSHGHHDAVDTSARMLGDVCGMSARTASVAVVDLAGLGLVRVTRRRGRFPLLVAVLYDELDRRLSAIENEGPASTRRRRTLAKTSGTLPRGFPRVA